MNSFQTAVSVGLSGGVVPMTCPKFDGDNPIMWKANCEAYFDLYGTHPCNWVKVATVISREMLLSDCKLLGLSWKG